MQFVIWLLVICILTNTNLTHSSEQEDHVNNTTKIKAFPSPVKVEDKAYWLKEGQHAILDTLRRAKPNTKVAKNVILFIGDGMGIQTVTAARILKGQRNGFSGEEAKLVFEDFPALGLSKVYNTDTQVPDSAGSGTAFMCGVKTRKGVIGYDDNVVREDCTTQSDEHKVFSIAKWSQSVGKRTGIVTTARVTDATPANAYAHSAERDWETDYTLPKDWEEKCPKLKDISAQLVEEEPGNKLNVILGGGYQTFVPDAVGTEFDPLEPKAGSRKDGRYLDQEWLAAKLKAGEKAALLRNRTQLMNQNLDNTDYLFGLFSNEHMPYAYSTRKNKLDIPSLAEMTEAAIKVLNKGDDGFFLLVEGAKIDKAHHKGLANAALDEAIEFDAAIMKALELLDIEETLIIVTADHSQTMNIAGYAKRGFPILGIAEEGEDEIPYTTILYASGPGYNVSVQNGTAVRQDPSKINTTTDYSYAFQSAAPRKSAAHGGEDVPIYAIGPWSHLFHTVHEETHIAHVMAYASCVGLYEKPCLGAPKIEEGSQEYNSIPLQRQMPLGKGLLHHSTFSELNKN